MTEPDETPEFMRRARTIWAMRNHLEFLENHPEIPINSTVGTAVGKLETTVHHSPLSVDELEALAARHGGEVERHNGSVWLSIPTGLQHGVLCKHTIFLAAGNPDRAL